MLRWIIVISGFIVSFQTPTRAADPKITVKDLAWMSGNWLEKKDGIETEENWTAPKGQMMLGVNRAVRGDRKAFFEYLRIEDTDKGVVYFASPQGRKATEFPLKSVEKEKVTFENLKHDFPKTITYWKADGKLHAKVTGDSEGRATTLEFQWDAVK